MSSSQRLPIVGAMRVEEAIEIPCPPQEVWDFVVDPMNDPLWCSKVQSVEAAGENRWVVRHRPVPLRPSIELLVQQLEKDEPRRLLIREEDDVSVFRVEYRVEPCPAGTRFVQASEFEWKKLPGFLHKTFEKGVRRDIRKQLRALRERLAGGKRLA